MKFRPTPPAATWLLKRFGPKPESETVIGDLHEQYQYGRSHIWYWQQVLAIVFFRFYRRTPEALASKAGLLLEHAFPLLLVSALLFAIVVAPFRLFLIIGAGIGVLAGVLKNAWDEHHETPERPDPLSIYTVEFRANGYVGQRYGPLTTGNGIPVNVVLTPAGNIGGLVIGSVKLSETLGQASPLLSQEGWLRQ